MRLPSIASLTCFVSAAKHLSFTKAADELCITQSAVSLQIKKLEQQLGCVLFNRIKQRLHITDAGASYAEKVALLLEQLDNATHELCQSVSGRLRIGVEASLTTLWLIPKLNHFHQLYPEIETDFISDLHQLYELHEGYDVGILYGDGQWPGFYSQFLMQEEFVAVCSPSLKKKYKVAKEMKDVLNYPFLHHTSQPSSTVYWLSAAGLSGREIGELPGQRFEHFKLLMDAAIHGLGLAILPKYIAANEIEQGNLVMAFEETVISRDSYYIVTADIKKHELKVKAFTNWLLSWRAQH